MRIVDQKVTFVGATGGNIEEEIVKIARVSSKRENKASDYVKLIKYLINNNHWSPFEHGYLTYELITTRAIGAQLLRHRSFTFQEFSQRYSEVEEVIMPEIRKQAETNYQSSTEIFDPIVKGTVLKNINASLAAKQSIEFAFHTYKELLEAGVARESARMVLPMCAATKIYMTGNVRSWLHFLNLRLDAHAQKEVQELAMEIYADMKDRVPNIMKAYFLMNND